ncbi:inositol monophosphatase 3-like [Hydractinia symbiolongicarpus]|uniref:inositol monophosphatase 3-like n=1 Tax=Hydractinia symbiolongicarpus TaxID=13093 RepID=UPI00255126CD|nr:inositol monophosphatase 3-like [Hydractinia symbiolongicarpus]
MQCYPSFRISRTETMFGGLILFLMILYLKSTFTPTEVVVPASKVEFQTVSLTELLVAAIEAAERGGNMVRKVKEEKKLEVKSKGKTFEGADDPVTLGDMMSHKQMYYSLLQMFPDLHIVSEEKSNELPDLKDIKPIDLSTKEVEKHLGSSLNSDARIQDVAVWIDPLDATKEYTEDLTEYVTTMVCVAHKGEPIIGVIHRPFLKQTIWAWVGHGRSDVPDYQTSVKDVHTNDMRIIVSRSHAGAVSQIAKKSFGESAQVIAAGGAGYKALKVAQRNFHAYIHTTAIKKWDICAGNALLKTMGGDMTDLLGRQIDYSYPMHGRSAVKLNKGLLATFKDHKLILEKLEVEKDPHD